MSREGTVTRPRPSEARGAPIGEASRPDARSSERLGAWGRFARALVQGSTPESLCDAVCRELVNGFGFSRTLLAIVDQKKERLVTKAGYDPEVPTPVLTALRKLFTIPLVPQEDGRYLTAAWCVVGNEQIYVPDATNYSHRLDRSYQRPLLVNIFGAKEYVLTPLQGPDGPIGLIAADKKGQASPISTEELEILEIVGSLTGMALASRERPPYPPHLETPPAETRAGTPARSDEMWQVQAVLDALHAGLVIVGGEGSVRYLNRAATALLELLPWDAVGRPWHEVMICRRPEEFRKLLAECPAHVPQRLRRWILQLPSGRVRKVDVEILPLASQQVSDSRAIFLQDVTDESEAERVRDEFVSMLVHDLNAPLQSIVGFAELLLMGRAGELNETQRDLIGRIEGSGHQMTELVGDILEMAKLESGAVLLDREVLVARDLVGEVLGGLRGRADPARVDLRNRVDGTLPPIHGDRVRLSEVVRNIVDNAIDASEAGRSITVEADVTSVRDRPFLRLVVRDQGSGLDEQAAAHLFDKFWSRKRSRDGNGRSRGLGLVICRLVVEAHGGEIWAEGTPGEGTTVTFTVPVVRETAEATPVIPESASADD